LEKRRKSKEWGGVLGDRGSRKTKERGGGPRAKVLGFRPVFETMMGGEGSGKE